MKLIVVVVKCQNIHVISNLKYASIYTKTWQYSLFYIQQRLIQNPFNHGGYLLGGNYFRKSSILDVALGSE